MTGQPRKPERFRASVIRNMAASLSDDTQICPQCAKRYVVPGTKAAKLGICTACWMTALKEATEAANAEESARRAYDTARQRKHREKKRRAEQ